MFWGLLLTFVVLTILIIGFFKLSCFVKRKYKDTENSVYRLLTSFMCESCREACERPLKLVLRAIMFAFIITLVAGLIVLFVK